MMVQHVKHMLHLGSICDMLLLIQNVTHMLNLDSICDMSLLIGDFTRMLQLGSMCDVLLLICGVGGYGASTRFRDDHEFGTDATIGEIAVQCQRGIVIGR